MLGKMNRRALFEKIWDIAAEYGGERLFGRERDRIGDVFSRCFVGGQMPYFWLESPLIGEAYTDLHVFYDREMLSKGKDFEEGSGYGYQGLFDWYANEDTGGIGLNLAFDMTGDDTVPAAYVNVNRKPLDDMRGFFVACGQEVLAKPFMAFLEGMPEGMEEWYLGVFPNRSGVPARVGLGLDNRWKDPERLGKFVALTDDMKRKLYELSQFPYNWEIQQDIFSDGSVGDVFSLDLCLPQKGRKGVRELLDNSDAMVLLEKWGIADERWKIIPQVSFARILSIEGTLYFLQCLPVFIKIKWKAGKILDSKVYMHCIAKHVQ